MNAHVESSETALLLDSLHEDSELQSISISDKKRRKDVSELGDVEGDLNMFGEDFSRYANINLKGSNVKNTHLDVNSVNDPFALTLGTANHCFETQYRGHSHSHCPSNNRNHDRDRDTHIHFDEGSDKHQHALNRKSCNSERACCHENSERKSCTHDLGHLRDHNHGHHYEHDHGNGEGNSEGECCGHDHGSGWKQYMPHAHGLEHRIKADKRSLICALIILAISFTGQFIGGIAVHSSILKVEAVHTALDGLTVVISLISVIIASREPTRKFSYGYSRAEVLSALVSVMALGLLCFKLFVGAGARLISVFLGRTKPVHGQGQIVFLAEGITLLNNLLMALVLTRRANSLNIRALRAHIIADSIENAVVLLAGILMWKVPSASIVDPLMSLVIVIVIVVMNHKIARETISVLMQASPSGLDTDKLRIELLDLHGVHSLGTLHIWTLTSGTIIGNVTLFMDYSVRPRECFEELQEEADRVLRKFGLQETCIQIRSALSQCDVGSTIRSDSVYRHRARRNNYDLVEADAV